MTASDMEWLQDFLNNCNIEVVERSLDGDVERTVVEETYTGQVTLQFDEGPFKEGATKKLTVAIEQPKALVEHSCEVTEE